MGTEMARIQNLLKLSQQMTEADVMAGLPLAVVERLKTEPNTPLVAALSLSDAFWTENPYKGEKGASRAVRVVRRDEALIRALAFYRLKGGKDLEKTAVFFEETFAAAGDHDGKVGYSP